MPTPSVTEFIGNQTKVLQTTGAPTAAALEKIDQLLVVVPADAGADTWRSLPQGNKLRDLVKRAKRNSVPAISTRLPNKRQTGVQLGVLPADGEAFDHLTFARKLTAAALNEQIAVLGIWVIGTSDDVRLTEQLAAAALAAAYVLPNYKARKPPVPYKTLRVLGHKQKLDLSRVQAEAAGNNLARAFTSLPANKLDADAYCDVLKELAGNHDWQFKRYSVKELAKMGAGAFLAVAQGNEDDSAAVIRLRYRPGKKGGKPDLSLVGKGIIFDTGGTNLKPFTSMLEMHIDMGGSAVAVGTLLTISQLKLPAAVDCWLAITENRTGPRAYKSQDVVTAANGKTIQVIHTDAEGRMALADVLHFASKDKPRLMIDYATLTGACMNAVTTRYSGVFTNRPDLHPVLKKSGRDSGERVWPFPVAKEFLEELKSETADIKQCSPAGGGDHILAATFLNEFVNPTVPWVHVDLSACTRKGGLGHVGTTITGFGVRFTMNLLLDQQLLPSASGSS